MPKTIILTGYGYRISKKGEMIVIYKKNGEKREFSCGNIKRIVAFTKGLSISGEAIRLLLKHNISLILVSRNRPIGRIESFRRGAPVKLKKEQVYAQRDERTLYIARTIVYGKISNQIRLLRWLRRSIYRRKKMENKILYDGYREIMDVRSRLVHSPLSLDDYREKLMYMEAEASRIYWETLANILPKELKFESRKKRFERPEDILNLSLNYLYTLLASEVWDSIELSGLDPWIGFLHKDSNRRPSLVMDLMEEFRQPVVDKPLLKFLHSLRKEFDKLVNENKLEKNYLNSLSSLFYQELDRRVTFNKYYGSIEHHMRRQPMRLAKYIMKRSKEYIPYNVL